MANLHQRDEKRSEPPRPPWRAGGLLLHLLPRAGSRAAARV